MADVNRLAAPESAPARTAPPQDAVLPAEDHWPAAVAAIAVIMVVIFCAVVTLTAATVT